jgi:hypothetical protein
MSDEARIADEVALDEISALNGALDSAEAKIKELRAEIERRRALNAEMLAALRGMLMEWEKLSRQGSPMAKAANERVNAARAAIAKAEQARKG